MTTLKDTSILGCLNLIPALILDSKPTVKHSKQEFWQQRKSIELIKIILMCFQIANNVATLNLKLFQQIVEVTHMELYHILIHLLSYLQYFYHVDNNDSNTSTKQNSSNSSITNDSTYNVNMGIEHLLLDEVIMFIGYCAVNNKKFQQRFHWGKEPNVIQKLCRLPFVYLSNPKFSFLF